MPTILCVDLALAIERDMNWRLPPIEIGDALPLQTSSLPFPMPCLGVVMPVFNEAATVEEILKRVLAQPCVQEVVAVDDGSTDETAAILREWPGKDPRVQLVSHSVNRGKGAAIRTGLALVSAPLLIIQDADWEYDPQDYGRIIKPLRNGESLVVYGSRYLEMPMHRGSRVFRWGVAVLNVMVRMLYGVRLTDEATCYKAAFTRLLRSMDLKCERFEFCPELTAKVGRLGLSIREVPISYHPRGKAEGKKIRWVDGLSAMRTLWKWRHWSNLEQADSTDSTAVLDGSARPNRSVSAGMP